MGIGRLIPAKTDAEGIHKGEDTEGKQISAGQTKLACCPGQKTGEAQDVHMKNIEKEGGLAEYRQGIPGARGAGTCTLISKEDVQT